MAGSTWYVQAGVKLDTSDIQSQLNKAVGKNLKIGGKNGIKAMGSGMQDTMLTFQVANAIFSKTVDIIKSMSEQVIEVNSSLTEFKKVSDLDGRALDAYSDKLAKAGQNVARTRSEMIDAATQFKKSGYSESESAQLAETAAMFQNVADTEISASEAAASIISQLKAFGMGASDATRVIDVYNATANNFAVGTNDISAAMEVAGAALSTYGNSFEQTTSLVTAGSEIMQGKSLQVARGLNTIAARIVANEDALKKYDVAVQDDNNNLRSTFDILKDLKPAWDSMNEVERIGLGQKIAGTNQYKVLASVMENMTTAVDAYAVAQEAAGSASRENARYMESLNKMGLYKQV